MSTKKKKKVELVNHKVESEINYNLTFFFIGTTILRNYTRSGSFIGQT